MGAEREREREREREALSVYDNRMKQALLLHNKAHYLSLTAES